MFKVTRVDDKRLDIEMSGKLDSVQMRVVLDELLEKSAGIENGQMLYDVNDYHLPSLGAIAIELSHLPALFSMIRRFHKAAVLTDKGWIGKIGELKSGFLPGLEIRAFTREQRSEAEAWLEKQPPIL